MDNLYDKVLFAIPENWVWSVEQPRIKSITRVPGQKKPKPQRYTAFVANEAMFGTFWYCSAFVDGSDYVKALQDAYNEVLT